MKKILILLLLFVLAGCQNASDKPDLEEELGLTNLSTVEMFAELNVLGFTNKSVSTSANDQVLSITSGDQVLTYEMPDDAFYVAIAPYIDSTHTCTIHSVSGCRGELVEEEFMVKIVDDAGNTVFDEKTSTMQNGFFELWLPREISGTMYITYNGLQTFAEISTYEGNNTCITTIQLT